jgi:PTS system cellobiose-specific IIC component
VRRIYDISARLYDNPAVSAVRNGLLLIFPLIMIGSFAALFQNLYVSQLDTGILGAQWRTIFQFISFISTGIVSAALTVTISYCMAGGTDKTLSSSVMPVIPSIVSLICYFALTLDLNGTQINYPMSAGGMFAAIFTALVSARLFTLLYDFLKKRVNYSSLDKNRYLTQVLLSLVPAFIVILVFLMLRYAVIRLGYSDSNSTLSYLLTSLFENIGSLLAKLVIFVLIVHLFWFLGIHGNMMLGSAMRSIIDDASALEQIKIISAGSASNTPGDMTMTFINVYVFVGGVGSTICLLAAIFIASRRTNAVKLAKISLLPALFNINEIMVFGIPIVLNPVFLIPFLLCPIIMLLFSYLAIISGLLPPVCQTVHWAVPPLFNAYLANGSIMGPIVQLLCIALGTLLYIPFVKLNEKIVSDRANSTYQLLRIQIEECKYGDGFSFLKKNDSVGFLAYLLSEELKAAIKGDKLMLEYQPLVNDKHGVIGLEALLRWPHEKFGRIPPAVTIAIAEEFGCMDELGRWVIRTACRQLAGWNSDGHRNISLSVNVSPTQLKDKMLAEYLEKCIAENNLKATDVELEITENVVMDLDSGTKGNIDRIKAYGVKLAMDDFGMGYTSLLYIRHCNIDRIKIDGSITRDILKDKNCQDIVSSMVYLCKSLNIQVIAEYVENEEQYTLLKELGCSEYQGYLFSPPIPPDKVPDYLNKLISECIHA